GRVSVPIGWDELGRAQGQLSVPELLARLLRSDPDPWPDYFTLKQRLPTPVAAAKRRRGRPEPEEPAAPPPGGGPAGGPGWARGTEIRPRRAGSARARCG